MSIRQNARVLRAKTEAAYNTDPACVTGDEVRCWGLFCKPKHESTVHDLLDATPGGIGASVGMKTCPVEFSTYLAWENAANGNSATPGELEPLFKAAGYKVVYTPEVGGDNAGYVTVTRQTHALSTGAANGSSCAFEAYEDSSKRLVLGARGGFVSTFKYGQPAEAAWKMLGKASVPSSVAIPVTSIDLQQPPAIGGANCLVLTPSGGAAYYPKWLELTIDHGNSAVAIPSGNDADFVDTIEITETKMVTGTLTIVRELEATHPFEVNVRLHKPYSLALTVGSVVQNRLLVTLANIQVLDTPIEADSGSDVFKLPFVASRTLAVGGDDVVYKWT